MLQTFKVHFVLKVEKTNQKGLAPIFARIRLNGTKMEISTNRVIYPDNWSPENEAAHPLTKANKELNQYLETFKGKVYSGYSTLLGSGQDLSSELLRHAIFGNPLKKRYNLIEVAKEHNEQFERLIGRKYSYGSFKNYKTTLKYLIEFIPIEYKRLDIPLEKADYKFCEKFFGYYYRMMGKGSPRMLSTSTAVAIAEAGRMIFKLLGKPTELGRGAMEMLSKKNTVSNKKAHDLLGWYPQVDLEEGMRRTEVWLREQGLLK